MRRRIKKVFNICIIIVILVAIAFTALMLILKYDNDGETNMPFYISKISIISSTDAEDVEDDSNKWNKIINLNNDIYIYIDKNEDYNKKETIKNITINNFKIVQGPNKGELAIYRPSDSETSIFNNTEENRVTEIVFSGDLSTDIQNLKISNQGGGIAFRCTEANLGTYVSNDDEIEYNELLKKSGITYDDIYAKISFDIKIELDSGKQFLATYEMEIPVQEVIENGTSGNEITEFDDLVFKRIEN